MDGGNKPQSVHFIFLVEYATHVCLMNLNVPSMFASTGPVIVYSDSAQRNGKNQKYSIYSWPALLSHLSWNLYGLVFETNGGRNAARASAWDAAALLHLVTTFPFGQETCQTYWCDLNNLCSKVMSIGNQHLNHRVPLQTYSSIMAGSASISGYKWIFLFSWWNTSWPLGRSESKGQSFLSFKQTRVSTWVSKKKARVCPDPVKLYFPWLPLIPIYIYIINGFRFGRKPHLQTWHDVTQHSFWRKFTSLEHWVSSKSSGSNSKGKSPWRGTDGNNGCAVLVAGWWLKNPSEKIWVRQLGWLASQDMGK